MKSKKWIRLKEVGQLKIEIVLIQFDMPLLFVCIDESFQRYLVLCINEEEFKYIIVRVSLEKIVEMLTDKIPMDEVFKNSLDSKVIYIEYDFSDKKFHESIGKSSEILEENLPDQGAYFTLKNAKIDKYINTLNEKEVIQRKYDFNDNRLYEDLFDQGAYFNLENNSIINYSDTSRKKQHVIQDFKISAKMICFELNKDINMNHFDIQNDNSDMKFVMVTNSTKEKSYKQVMAMQG